MRLKRVRAGSAVSGTSLGETGLHALQRREDRRPPLLEVENTHKHVAIPAGTRMISNVLAHRTNVHARDWLGTRTLGGTGQARAEAEVVPAVVLGRAALTS